MSPAVDPASPGQPFIALVGMPGSGKSTVGRQLARRLGVSFSDSDLLIEQRLGCPIRDFFAREGEEAFRGVEESVLQDLTARATGVLATGGGTVLRPGNRVRLRSAARVVYLQSTPEELLRRVRHDVNRPLLQVDDPLARLRELHAVRDPLYRETAHLVIETGRPSISTLVQLIMMRMDLPRRPPP